MESSEGKRYRAISYYLIQDLSDPGKDLQEHKEFLSGKDVKGRIYITTQGINGQLSSSPDAGEEYIEWLKGRYVFPDHAFKIDACVDHVFPRLTIKLKQELVALGQKVDMAKRGQYLSPSEWRKAMESDEDYILIDVRNDYEWKIGHFEGAQLPACKTFKDFIDYADQVKKQVDEKDKKVLMCCTGGIRCEVYSALLKEKGIENVFQLEGGIINYGKSEGAKHWKGRLFVFDDRMNVPIADDQVEELGHCSHCGDECGTYYNCANMDCNALFLSCEKCIEEAKGCCDVDCIDGPRVRPREMTGKPFRRWYTYFSKLSGPA